MHQSGICGVVIAALGLVACGRSERSTSTPEETTGEARGTVISTRDGTKFFGDDVAVDVYNYGTPGYVDKSVMVFLAGNGNEVWTAQVQIDRNFLGNGGGTATIKRAPLEVGIANVERKRGDYPVAQPDSGTLMYSFAEGQRVDVAVDTDADSVAASISARFQVRCWVNAQEVSNEGEQTPGQPSEGVAMALDEHFTTPQCEEYKEYGP